VCVYAYMYVCMYVCMCVCVYVFTPFQQETSIISSYSIHRLVILMAVHILAPKVPKEWLYSMYSLQCRSVSVFKAMPCQPHTTVVRLRSQANPFEVFLRTQWHRDRIISDQFYCTLSVPLHKYSIHHNPHNHSALMKWTSGQTRRTLNQNNALPNIGDQWAGKNLYTVV
jgi:hypothetical protein